MNRANPFADLSDFEAQSTTKPVPVEAIEEIAEQQGFPSRKSQPKRSVPTETSSAPKVEEVRSVRRYTTGRNRQINIKATSETIDRFYRLADEQGVPLGALFEQALDALAAQTSR